MESDLQPYLVVLLVAVLYKANNMIWVSQKGNVIKLTIKDYKTSWQSKEQRFMIAMVYWLGTTA